MMDALANQFEKMDLSDSDEEAAPSELDRDAFLRQEFDCSEESSEEDDDSTDSDWLTSSSDKMEATNSDCGRQSCSVALKLAGFDACSGWCPLNLEEMAVGIATDYTTTSEIVENVVGVQLNLASVDACQELLSTDSNSPSSSVEREQEDVERKEQQDAAGGVAQKNRASAAGEKVERETSTSRPRVARVASTTYHLEVAQAPSLVPSPRPADRAITAGKETDREGCIFDKSPHTKVLSSAKATQDPLSPVVTSSRSTNPAAGRTSAPAHSPFEIAHTRFDSLFSGDHSTRTGSPWHETNKHQKQAFRGKAPYDSEPPSPQVIDRLQKKKVMEVIISSSSSCGPEAANAPHDRSSLSGGEKAATTSAKTSERVTPDLPKQQKSPDQVGSPFKSEKPTQIIASTNIKAQVGQRHMDGSSEDIAYTVENPQDREIAHGRMDGTTQEQDRGALRPEVAQPTLKPVQNRKSDSNKTRSPPQRRPNVNEVCVILDSSNTAMEKFLTPLKLNLGLYWEVLSSCSEVGLRMSMLTPSKKIEFISNKLEFLSSCKDIMAGEEVRRRDDMSIIEGLERCLARLGKLRWTQGSARYVYILTNLSGWESNKSNSNALKWKLCNLMRRHLPIGAATLVGSWMNDNRLLEEALVQAHEPFQKFPLLNVKEMAVFVVPDRNLVQGVLASMNCVGRKRKKICFGMGSENAAAPSREVIIHVKRPTHFILSEATIFQVTPLKTINEVLSNTRPTFCSRSCWMKRTKLHYEGRDAFLSLGKIGPGKGEWQEDVMLKSFKLDEIKGWKAAESNDSHRSQAFVAAIANFFAIQYNKEHRPQHCSRISFLNGYVIEQMSEEGDKREFYAEQLLEGMPRFTQYCNGAGQWDESMLDESLLRFSLTCFKISGGDFMLSGLKGTHRGNDFFLKAPVLLSKKNGNAHTGECTKEYMTMFRKSTKRLIDEGNWSDMKAASGKAEDSRDSKGRKEPEPYFGGLFH